MALSAAGSAPTALTSGLLMKVLQTRTSCSRLRKTGEILGEITYWPTLSWTQSRLETRLAEAMILKPWILLFASDAVAVAIQAKRITRRNNNGCLPRSAIPAAIVTRSGMFVAGLEVIPTTIKERVTRLLDLYLAELLAKLSVSGGIARLKFDSRSYPAAHIALLRWPHNRTGTPAP